MKSPSDLQPEAAIPQTGPAALAVPPDPAPLWSGHSRWPEPPVHLPLFRHCPDLDVLNPDPAQVILQILIAGSCCQLSDRHHRCCSNAAGQRQQTCSHHCASWCCTSHSNTYLPGVHPLQNLLYKHTIIFVSSNSWIKDSSISNLVCFKMLFSFWCQERMLETHFDQISLTNSLWRILKELRFQSLRKSSQVTGTLKLNG